jgi:hypothetical protein
VSQEGTPLNHILVIKLDGSWVLIKLERADDVTKVVVFKFQETRDHLSEVTRVLLRTSLVCRANIAALLNDTCGVIKWPTGDVALLRGGSVGALDVQDETVGGELLATSDLDDIPRLNVGPCDRLEPLKFGSDHQKLKHLVVDLVRDLSLTQLEGDVPNGHECDID